MVVVVSTAGADTLVGGYVDGKKQDFVPAARVRQGIADCVLGIGIGTPSAHENDSQTHRS